MEIVQEQKLELLEWLASIQDKELIQELMNWKLEHQKIDQIEYNRELEEADAEVESGNYLAHDEAIKEIKSWRGK